MQDQSFLVGIRETKKKALRRKAISFLTETAVKLPCDSSSRKIIAEYFEKKTFDGNVKSLFILKI